MLLQWRFDHDPSNARGSAARTMIRTPSSGGRAGRHSKRKSGNGGLSNIGIGLRLTSGSRRVGSGTPGGSISISGSGIVSGTGLDGHGIRIDRFLLVLRLAWSLVVVYGEVVMFSSAVSRCKWPNKFGYDLTRSGSKPFHLLLVADPQVLDLRSNPSQNIARRYVRMWMSDNFARKAWRMALKTHRPDAVFFLGDLLDSGVEVTDRDEHSHYVHRFQNIFRPRPFNLPMYHVPGNHDLGLHLTPGGSAYARERFLETFGPLNGRVDLGNHTLVWIDAPGYLDETEHAPSRYQDPTYDATNGGVIEHLQHIAKQTSAQSLPRILFSHIPLHRPEGSSCGPLRESRRLLHQVEGKNYQTEIDQTASKFLLESVRPSLIFSGDDHDYCEYTHHLALSSPVETTCKSFSLSQDLRQPGYQLVSLLNPLDIEGRSMDPSSTHYSQLCLLPNQMRVYTRLYIPCILLTLCILGLPRIYYNLRPRQGTSARSNGLPMHSSSLARVLRRGVKAADNEDADEAAVISESEDEMMNSSYSTSYPISPPHANYAYSSPTDDDYASIVTPFEIIPRQGVKNRVRRVSRVWLWDPESSENAFMRGMKRLGPVYRYFIRPIERVTRQVVRRVYGRRLQILFAKLNSGNVVGETVEDLIAVLWVALVVYGSIWLWFTW